MSNVIKFPYRASRRLHARKPRRSKNGTAAAAEPALASAVHISSAQRRAWRAEARAQIIGGNKKLRARRDRAWEKACATTYYWKMRLKFETAISIAQRNGVLEGARHPATNPAEYFSILKFFRSAQAMQLLTPAPSISAVNWKQLTAKQSQHFTDLGVTAERIEKAIADDLAFLRAHPTRRPRDQQSKISSEE